MGNRPGRKVEASAPLACDDLNINSLHYKTWGEGVTTKLRWRVGPIISFVLWLCSNEMDLPGNFDSIFYLFKIYMATLLEQKYKIIPAKSRRQLISNQ